MLSILIPTFKAQNFIKETIESIENQTLKIPYEIIVIIDGCPDTLQHFSENVYTNVIPIYCPENKGRYIASNTAIEYATGDDILFMDSDDLLMPHALEEIYKYKGDIRRFRFQKFEDKKILVDETAEKFPNQFYCVSTKSRKTFKIQRYYSEKISGGHANGIVWMKRKVIETLGGFRSWKCSADTELLKRLEYTDYKVDYIQKPIFWYRQHQGSLTNTIAMRNRLHYHSIINTTKYGKHNVTIIPETNKGEYVYK